MAGTPHVKRGLFGVGRRIIVYHCRNCAAKLKSPLDEAGTADTCPACGATFIVPGADERDRLHCEKLAKEEAKRASAEAKRRAKTEPVSSDAVPPNQTDTSPPLLDSQPSRKRFIAAIATAASLAILVVGGLAFHLGRQSGVRPTTAEPQPNIWDASAWQRAQASSATPLTEETTKRNPQDTPNWWENDPIAGGTKETAAQEPSETRRIIAASEESVVMLEVPIRNEPSKATGSGFVLRPGVVVTNYHVIEDAAKVMVKFEDGRDVYSDGYLAVDKKNDLALLKCDTGSIKSLPLGEMPHKLDPVYAIGSPRGVSGTISNGIVSGLIEKKRTGTMMIQTTAPISPGSSGGPLLNDKGQVVGVTTEAFADAQNLNFAVATTHVAALETVAQKFARPWRDLPVSAAVKRRTELKRLAARIDEARKVALIAGIQCDRTWELYLEAQSECDELARHQKAFLEQMEGYRLAGNGVMFEQYTRELDSGRGLAILNEALAKRDKLGAKVMDEKKRAEDLMREAEKLRMEYDELRVKQAVE